MADRDLHLFPTDGSVPNVASNYFFFRQGKKVQRDIDFSQKEKNRPRKIFLLFLNTEPLLLLRNRSKQ